MAAFGLSGRRKLTMKQVEVQEVRFWNAASDETVMRWITAPGLEVMRRQCKPTGRKKMVDRSEVASEIWQGVEDSD